MIPVSPMTVNVCGAVGENVTSRAVPAPVAGLSTYPKQAKHRVTVLVLVSVFPDLRSGSVSVLGWGRLISAHHR